MKKLFTLKTLTLLLIVASVIALCIATISWAKRPPYYAVFAADDTIIGDSAGENNSGDTGETTPSEPEEKGDEAGTTPSESEDKDNAGETTPSGNEVKDDAGDTTPSETEVKLEEILAKLNAQSASDYFKQNILPLITGTGSALAAGLLALLPYIKNKNRRKQLEAYAATLQKANSDLDTLLKSTDPEAIKKAVDGLFGERATEIVNEMIKQIPIDNKRINELATEIGTVNAKLDCLIKGAQNAWSKSSAATAALTSVPEKSLLVEKEAENTNLKAYIRAHEGAQADKLISDICCGKIEEPGESENDE